MQVKSPQVQKVILDIAITDKEEKNKSYIY